MSTASQSFLGFLSLFPIAVLSAAACGGSAFDNGAGLAGSNSNGIAGNTGLAGSSTAGGGESSNGGGGNSAGATHAGGAAHGGSGGLDVSACTSNSQCEVVPISCCGCGTGPISNFTAINAAYEMQFSARCAAVDCAPCYPVPAPPLDDPRNYWVASCQKPAEASPDTPGRCVIVDLRATELTACKSVSDCSLRAGTGCCSGCSGSVVSLNSSHAPELSALVCGDEPVACPACAPIFDQYLTTCNLGRCGVEFNPCPASHPCP